MSHTDAASEGTETTRWLEGLPVAKLIDVLMSAGRVSWKPDDMAFLVRLFERREALRSASAAQPVAWFRVEDGIRVYYETQAWPDLTPLYATPLSTSAHGGSAKADMPCEVRDMLDALKDYEQADERGVYVKVSRQAVDEAVELISARYGKEENF